MSHTRWVSTAWAKDGGTQNSDAVDAEANNIADYMYNNTSGDFADYSYGYVPIGSTDGEKDFIKTMLEEIHNNSDYAGLAENETVLIPHDNWTWGYGRELAHEVETDHWVYGATVYAGDRNPARRSPHHVVARSRSRLDLRLRPNRWRTRERHRLLL